MHVKLMYTRLKNIDTKILKICRKMKIYYNGFASKTSSLVLTKGGVFPVILQMSRLILATTLVRRFQSENLDNLSSISWLVV